ARVALAGGLDRAQEEAAGARAEAPAQSGGDTMNRAFLMASLSFVVAARAHAWDPFLVENEHVQAGNERMAANDAAGALTHYDRAARELPNEAGVHLNRGLALLEAGDLDRAREAFLLATEPPAPADVRADAYYDLGL